VLPLRRSRRIDASVSKVVELVKRRKNGMRAEEIRAALRMMPHEISRILREGLGTRRLARIGRKRATRYFAQ